MATFATRARTPNDIATSVRDARLAAGMSQADLAAAAHLSRPWVSLFESGRAPNASLSKVLAMMDVLGVAIRLTYTVPDSDPPAFEPARPRRHSPKKAQAVKAVEALRDDVDAPTAADPAPLSETALATARGIREAHRARAIADDLIRRPYDA